MLKRSAFLFYLAVGLYAATTCLGPLAGNAEGAGRSACSARNGKIAVIRRQSGGDELGLLKGGGFTRIYKVPYTKRIDFHEQFRLSDPSFSCDGKEIVVAQVGGVPWEALVVVDVANRRSHVVPTAHHRPIHPTYLADGQIAFDGPTIHHPPDSSFIVSRRGGTFVVDPNGSHLRRLFARQEITASRDGRWFVAYASARAEAHELFLLNARGKIVRPLAPPLRGQRYYVNPRFSANAKRIVFQERDSLPKDHSLLFEVRRDGSGLRRLTRGPESASEPSFSPDGRHILFTKSSSGIGGQPWSRSLEAPQRERRLALRTGYEFPIWGPR
jgi:Tol biopolymer transport system component